MLAVVADGSKGVARALTWYAPTGALSGVSTVAIGVWLLVWVLLARMWKTRTVAMGRVNAVGLGLLLAGLLLTFPPFGDLLLGR